MQIDADRAGSGPIIRGFAGSGFRVDGDIFPTGLLITGEWARGWHAPAIDALDLAAIEDVLVVAPRPEFLLLGTGPTLRRPPAAFVAALEARDIGVEAMDSRAAARAWGILRSEDRWIVGALLPLA